MVRAENSVHQLIPPRDSEKFLADLVFPTSAENQAFRSIIIGNLTNRIQRTLLATDQPVIGFSDNLYSGDPAFVPDEHQTDQNGRYILTDSERFFTMLDTNPSALSVDCLNILPITIIGATRDTLLDRGYKQEAIDTLLNGTIIHGDKTEMVLHRKRVKPLARLEPFSSVRSFSNYQENVGAAAEVREEGVLPFTVLLDTDVSPGDLLFTISAGLVGREDFDNIDSQSAVFLNHAQTRTPAESVRVFAHQSDIRKRKTYVGDVFRMLTDAALKKGVSMPEYFDQGGIKLSVVQFDYSGFYAAMAKSLPQK